VWGEAFVRDAAEIGPSDSVFHLLLEAYFSGEADGRTLTLLGAVSGKT
jgi:hypothetical protein